MTTTASLARIRNQPEFMELVGRRRSFVAWLTTLTLVPYYAFILVAAFAPNLLAIKVADTSVINLGWPVGLVLIVGTWMLTGLYVRRANREFDEVTAAILARAK